MPAYQPHLRVGVDVGGTFTDIVLFDERRARVAFHKTPSTPDDPARAIATGVAEIIAREGVDPAAVDYLGHGTTVATNMVIERRGAPSALVTTRGFRDVLEIARQTRPHLYDYRRGRPPPLVRRALRFEVDERLDAHGVVLRRPGDAAIAALIETLREARVEAVAICLLHAYRNAEHEILLAERIQRALPHLFVTRSSDVLAEFREFERTSTTVVNAYVGPRMAGYMATLTAAAAAIGITSEPLTMQSNGGLMTVDDVRRWPVRTCLSGPAAGVVAAARLGQLVHARALIAFDVGGTSTDVTAIADGRPMRTAGREVAGYAVRSPMVDVQVIGAGGGSIARVDAAGALKVGPESAGADPGPAAYGKGGTAVTLTDANIVLGRLNPAALLAGRMPLDAAAARAAVSAEVAEPLGLGVEAAALGIVDVAVANIARAIRGVSTAGGQDPADAALLAYGGAGPLLAVAVAREVQNTRVLVPREGGTLCARGMLLAPLSSDGVRTVLAAADAAAWALVCEAFAELDEAGEAWLEAARVAPAQRRLERWVEARYDGQSFEVGVSLDPGPTTLDAFIDGFHAAHRGIYGYDIPARGVVIVNVRVRAIGQRPGAEFEPAAAAGGEAEAHGSRPVFVAGGWREVPVYHRDGLAPGHRIDGPAIVEEMSSTLYLGPHDGLVVDAYGNLDVSVAKETTPCA